MSGCKQANKPTRGAQHQRLAMLFQCCAMYTRLASGSEQGLHMLEHHELGVSLVLSEGARSWPCVQADAQVVKLPGLSKAPTAKAWRSVEKVTDSGAHHLLTTGVHACEGGSAAPRAEAALSCRLRDYGSRKAVLCLPPAGSIWSCQSHSPKTVPRAFNLATLASKVAGDCSDACPSNEFHLKSAARGPDTCAAPGLASAAWGHACGALPQPC